MDSFSEGIKQERKKINLISKSDVIIALDAKINEVTGVIPDTIRKIALKALDDLIDCSTEEHLVICIKQWAEITSKQRNSEIQYFMNGMGSVLIRVDLSPPTMVTSDD